MKGREMDSARLYHCEANMERAALVALKAVAPDVATDERVDALKVEDLARFRAALRALVEAIEGH